MLHEVWERVMHSHSGGYCSDHVHLWYHWHSQRQGRFLIPMNDSDCVNVKVQRSTKFYKMFSPRDNFKNFQVQISDLQQNYGDLIKPGYFEMSMCSTLLRCDPDTWQPHRHFCWGRWRLWWHGRCRGPLGRRHSKGMQGPWNAVQYWWILKPLVFQGSSTANCWNFLGVDSCIAIDSSVTRTCTWLTFPWPILWRWRPRHGRCESGKDQLAIVQPDDNHRKSDPNKFICHRSVPRRGVGEVGLWWMNMDDAWSVTNRNLQQKCFPYSGL